MARLTPQQRESALDLASQGHTVKHVMAMVGVTPAIWYRELREDRDWNRAWNEARQVGIDALVDELIDVAQTEPDVQRARLYSDNVRWLASKLKPKVYGDRLELTGNVQLDLTAAMAEARNRVSALPTATHLLPGQTADEPNALPVSDGEQRACDLEPQQALEAPPAAPGGEADDDVDPYS